jgi:hypothetical protein
MIVWRTSLRAQKRLLGSGIPRNRSLNMICCMVY